MYDPTTDRDAPLELKVVVFIAALDAVLLLLVGVPLLRSGGTTGRLLGGAAITVAVAQSYVLVRVYQLRSWAWRAAVALLVAAGIIQLGTGDFLGAGVSVLIAGYLYTQRDLFQGA